MQQVKVDDVVREIGLAIQQGRLPERFRAVDVRRACPGWDYRTYNNFLPKYRLGNPGGHKVYFRRNPDGTYSLLSLM